MDNSAAKNAAGLKAAELIEEDMLVGLGTGSTAHFFITHLAERVKTGLSIQATASSKNSLDFARKLGIPLIDIDQVSQIDITVDGTDAIDSQKRMIKGAGGALLREKVLASNSREMIVLLDESKLATTLRDVKLPVEVAQFGYNLVLRKMETLELKAVLRMNGTTPFITDNGNYLIDIQSIKDYQPEILEKLLKNIAGVFETGFFFDLAGRVIIGFNDGHVDIRG